MRKNTDKKNTADSEGTSNPELLFSDDVLVVNYLNSLLASDPVLNVDFKEIQILHQAIRTGWKPTSMVNTVAGQEIMLEADFSRIEAETLRNENEKLKFTTELATIDSQVLRSENNNLKAEIELLSSQLNEIKVDFQKIQEQNNELKSIIETSRIQLSESTENIKAPTHDIHTDSVPDMETTLGKVRDSEQREPSDFVDTLIDQKEAAESDSTVRHESTAHETFQVTSPTPPVVARECRVEDERSCTIELDRPFTSYTQFKDIGEGTINTAGTAVFSRKNVIEKSAALYTKPASKIIKQRNVVKHLENQQTDRVLQISSLSTEQQDKNINETILPSNSLQKQPVTEVLHKPDDNPDLIPATKPLDNTDDIDIEPTPAPKNIVRRNVKNYEDLQKESDSTHKTVAGHTIVL